MHRILKEVYVPYRKSLNVVWCTAVVSVCWLMFQVGVAYAVRCGVQLVPLIVETCARIVEEKGLQNQGIYRVSGNKGAINAMVDELNKVCSYQL